MDVKDVKIRRAVGGDVAQLVPMMHGLALYHGDPIEHITAEAVLRDGFGDAREYDLLVAEMDGEIVGYASFHNSYESAYAARGVYLMELFVAETARRAGVARRLVAAVAAEARARNRSFLWWLSAADNRDAQAAYNAMGAETEPLVYHALTLKTFERFAEEGERRT
ncbi:MAG: GNAT family N-acetyltransferase [Alphaproteobacteria bacterium]